jgi:hypothetical protein
MSSLRENVESSGQSLLTVHRRIDALLAAVENVFDRQEAVIAAVETLAGALGSVIEEDDLAVIDRLLTELQEDREQAAQI